ncbi:MAG: PEP-CTERM sorting domain-containing protein [Fimbriimonadaceae bacterium]|nr:PEP-CTERM sorting domain-containing protein [Fimbriimonadaceae bacterium]
MLLMTPINGWWRWSGSYLTSQATRDQAEAWNRDKLTGLLNTALGFNPGMTIYFASPTPETQVDNVAAGFNSWAADTAVLVQQLVVEYQLNGANIKYVPIFENISQTPGVHHFDGIHWNNAGAQVGADKFYETMTTESVPEPTSIVLMSIGVLALARKRRKN